MKVTTFRVWEEAEGEPVTCEEDCKSVPEEDCKSVPQEVEDVSVLIPEE